DRRHVDDRSAAALDHAGKNRPDHREHRIDVDLEAAPPVIDAAVEDRAVMDVADAIEQHVDPADAGSERTHGLCVRDVEHVRFAAFERCKRAAIEVDAYRSSAFAREALRGGATDALARACNDG